MLFDMVASIVILAMGFNFFTEYSKNPVYGLMAAIILISLGAWILNEGIYVRVGEYALTHNNSSIVHPPALNTTVIEDVDTIYTYEKVSTNWIELDFILGIVFIFLGIVNGLYYAFIKQISFGGFGR